MANQEHLDILKQGVKIWNRWRKEHPEIQPDLKGADFTNANLSEALLSNTNLSEANLSRINLNFTFLYKANLSGANLHGASFYKAVLVQANLSNADLDDVDFSDAGLSGANLSGANLTFTNFNHASLKKADLSQTRMGGTIFGDIDLHSVKGLKTTWHGSPSTIGIDTIIRSQGKIPEIFLRRAGVLPSIIEMIPFLVGSLEPIQYYTCFISYSSHDQDFADRLYADLQAKGVRCWYALYDIKTGDKWRDRIDESIRLHDKLLLILSHHSIESPRVEEEVVGAQEKEEWYFRETGTEQLVLFPIRLDEAVLQTPKAWASNLRRLRHIGNFTHWKNHDEYQKAFDLLLRDLKASAQQ